MKRTRLLSALALVALSGCAEVVRVRTSAPVSRPDAPGVTLYTVGRLSFQVPASWTATGDARRVSAVHPGNQGRLDVQLADRTFRDEAECLEQAEEVLQRGAADATGVRRHPTTFAGRKGISLEGDQGAWHGWAWGVCDGATQYRVSFFGAAPVREDVLAAWTALTRSARLD